MLLLTLCISLPRKAIAPERRQHPPPPSDPLQVFPRDSAETLLVAPRLPDSSSDTEQPVLLRKDRSFSLPRIESPCPTPWDRGRIVWQLLPGSLWNLLH